MSVLKLIAIFSAIRFLWTCAKMWWHSNNRLT